MSTTDMTAIAVDALVEVAPDVDPATLDLDAALREDLGLDSMDVLNLMVALHAATGVEVPEEDYGELESVRDVARYLAARSAAGSAGA
ncbi:MAG: acyl carrier protein [Solirubrobacteraceae bacterium]